MNPSNPHEHDSLDDLLRDIKVPADLKSKLKAIPALVETNTATASVEQTETRRNHSAFAFLLAASILGIAAFFTWPLLFPNDDPVANKTETNQLDVEIENNDSENTLEDNSGLDIDNPTLATNDDSVSSLELIQETLDELEIKRLEARLEQLNSRQQNQLAQNEMTSMILALADQTVVDLGGPKELANESMVKIIDQFPNTQGAVIAQQFLDQQTN
jgi:hypothetical protein